MMSLEAISEALTHSDQSITKIYINTKNTLKQTARETAFRIVKKRWGKFWWKLLIFEQKKDTQEITLECLETLIYRW